MFSGIMNDNTVFTKEALKAQDGKEIPLTAEPGGPEIGKATLRYHEELGELLAEFEVTNENLQKRLVKGLNGRWTMTVAIEDR